ncbi:MAG: TlpA family protein disulfide reductase [Pirellulaceae bacterium]|nr:TlpA family protein disulfide reductase [Pirellulaceae bacterium]
MITILFGTVLPWLLIAVGTWLVYQLARQNGRILLRLESIEKQIGRRAGSREEAKRREAGGLPVGTAAPDFVLPDLLGAYHKLSEFRGRDLLLVFFNPNCGFCTKMAADLAALPAESGDGRAVPIVITTGDAQENRKLVERYGIRCLVLLQKEMEVASQFRAQGTPMGYRIDGAGRIASELAVGAEPLLKLVNSCLHTPCADMSAHGVSGLAKDDPSLARSRLNRNGLKAGTEAPDFRLPRIDGGELSLADFQGQRVLLVFSDPDCGPCDELAPRLQEIHIQRPDLEVLVVSRRDLEANRTKAAALGLTFPIVLQKQWEISLKYAKFATPIGYLIDEQGILASDVAVGVEPILALANVVRSLRERTSLHMESAGT